MTRLMVLITNAVLPGVLLPWFGSPIGGLALMTGTMASLSVVMIGAWLATPEWWMISLIALLAYLALSAIASVVLWYCSRNHAVDRLLVKRLHDEIASAFLRGDLESVMKANALVRIAPREIGAWRLLELMARSTGDLSLATRAARRAAHLESAEG